MLLRVFNLQEGTAKLGNRMADIWIDFICERKWPVAIDGADVVVLGPEDACAITKSREYDKLYRGDRGQLLLKIGWKRCFNIAQLLQGVRLDI
jgi:hypothetical protein